MLGPGFAMETSKPKIGKNILETCLSTKTKETSKNLVTLKHFQKWPKNQGVTFSHSWALQPKN